MDSTLTQTMFMRGEVQLGTDKSQRTHRFQFPYCVGKFNMKTKDVSVFEYIISIPVLRGEVQLLRMRQVSGMPYFNSRTAWGSSTNPEPYIRFLLEFQFPYCVGKFNLSS